MKSVQFTNWTEKDFTWTWNSDPFTFKAHTTILLQDYLAKHFAKHLVDRELIEEGLQVNDQKRNSLLRKCIQDPEILKEVSDEKAEMELLNQNAQPMEQQTSVADKNTPFCDSCDSKGVRHKKGCPKGVKSLDKSPDQKLPEEEFEGLK